MKYTNSYTRANPGLIVFMIDQSASMSQIGYEGRPLAETAADMVNYMIADLASRFTYGPTMRMGAHIAIIGYGGQSSGYAELLRVGGIDELVRNPIRREVIKKKVYTREIGVFDVEIERSIVIEPEAGYIPNMTSAFELANSLINHWKEEYCCEDNHRCSSLTPAPLVINITKGSNNIGDDEELIKVSNQIKNIEFEDGNPLIVSILIPTHHYFECLSLPIQNIFAENLPGCERIWWSSSNVPEELKDTFRFAGYFIDVSNESKLIFVNPDDSVKIIATLVSRPGTSRYDSNIR